MKQRRTKEQLIFDLNVFAETGNYQGAIKEILDYNNRFGYDNFLSNYLNENMDAFLESERKFRKVLRKIEKRR